MPRAEGTVERWPHPKHGLQLDKARLLHSFEHFLNKLSLRFKELHVCNYQASNTSQYQVHIVFLPLT